MSCYYVIVIMFKFIPIIKATECRLTIIYIAGGTQCNGESKMSLVRHSHLPKQKRNIHFHTHKPLSIHMAPQWIVAKAELVK